MAKQENIIEVEEPIKQKPVQDKSISRKYLLLGIITLSVIFVILLTIILGKHSEPITMKGLYDLKSQSN